VVTASPGGAIMRAVRRFTVTIDGPNWEDVEDVELPELPREGDTIETRYGTCGAEQLARRALAVVERGRHGSVLHQTTMGDPGRAPRSPG